MNGDVPLGELLQKLRGALRLHFSDHIYATPDLDARLLVASACKLNDYAPLIERDRLISKEQQEKARAYIERRLKGEPVARILGEKEFFGYTFKLNEETLVPRPETEMIVEEALSYVHKRELSNKMLQIVDLGVGSGAILVSLLKELPRAVGFGVDISFKALEMAVINAKYHGVDERFFPICGNFGGALTGLFDIIVSNPPYIGLSEKDNLSIDVREFDPFKALFAGYDGLKAYRDLFPFIRKHLKADGLAVLEHGKDQAIALQKMAKSADLCVFETFLDMADLPRFLKILGNDRINS